MKKYEIKQIAVLAEEVGTTIQSFTKKLIKELQAGLPYGAAVQEVQDSYDLAVMTANLIYSKPETQEIVKKGNMAWLRARHSWVTDQIFYRDYSVLIDFYKDHDRVIHELNAHYENSNERVRESLGLPKNRAEEKWEAKLKALGLTANESSRKAQGSITIIPRGK